MLKGFQRAYVIFLLSLAYSTQGHLGYSMVYVTINSAGSATELANSIVASNLAACVNILPGITSVYKWEGKVQSEPELLLMIKTRKDLLESLSSFIKSHHPYSVPEIIAVPIEFGNSEYLAWIDESTKS